MSFDYQIFKFVETLKAMAYFTLEVFSSGHFTVSENFSRRRLRSEKEGLEGFRYGALSPHLSYKHKKDTFP